MTYLQLCQALCSELGLSGAGPNIPATAQASNLTILEQINATRWIHDSALQLDNLWQDWKYLWNAYPIPAVALGATGLPSPGVGVTQWDLNKIRWRPAGAVGQYQPLQYFDRQEFLDFFDPDNAVPGPPEAFTIEPDNTIVFASPLDASYDFLTEFWQRPVELINDTDVPLMPPQHHRIIMCRAAAMYGNREDAPEVIAGLTAEYIDMLDKLQADQLEGFALRRTSTDRERPAPSRQRLSDFLQ